MPNTQIEETAISTENTYFKKRMELIGFDPDKHFATYEQRPGETGGTINYPLFFADKKGQLAIPYFDLHGLMYTRINDTTSITRYELFYRYRKEDPIEGKVYLPNFKGFGVRPYLTLPLIKAYQEEKKIKTLVIVEGEIKAFVAAENGVYVLAIPGISIWKKKGTSTIFEEIEEIIKVCKVDEIIYLIDADLFDVKWKEGKDLWKRPFNFYSSVKNFKQLCSDFGIDMWLVHIKTELKEKAIDDLLIAYPKKKRKIINELTKQSGSTEYFKKYFLNDWTINRIKKFFFIDGVEDFYSEYSSVIGLHPFIYHRGEFQYDDEAKELVCKKSKEAAGFVAIGNAIYTKGARPNLHGPSQSDLLPIKQQAMMLKLGSQALFKRVLFEIDFYDGAFNLPSHTDYTYSRETKDIEGNVTKWYNMYRPLSWIPTAGDFTHSIKFVKHIFGEKMIKWTNKAGETKEFPEYELGLDYFQLLWEKPTQTLPILCLVSEERETGKSTYWDWLRAIFQQNARKIHATELSGQFTSLFATALLVVMEETHIEKKQLVEIIKEMATSKDGKLEGKFQNAETINQFIKLGMSSNNANNFALIDQEENRFWVREIKKISEENLVSDFYGKLIEEVPAFLAFIQQRKMMTTNEGRMHFHPELILTDALLKVKKGSRTGLEKVIDEFLKDQFLTTKECILNFSIPDLKERVEATKDKSYYMHILNEKWKMKPSNHSKEYRLYSYYYDQGRKLGAGEYVLDVARKKSICYTFFASDFLTKEAIFSTYTIENLLKLEAKLKAEKKETFWKKIKLDYIWNLHDTLKSHLEASEENMVTIAEMIKEYSSLAEFWAAIEKKLKL